MKQMRLIAIVGFIATVITAHAQKMVQEMGDVSMLAGQNKMLVEYDFSELDMGKYGNEKEYLNKKRTELNEKEAGKGDKWVEGWEKNKENRYEPKFEELFNKVLADKMMISTTYKDAKYKLVVKTLTLYPGYNIGVSKIPAYCSYSFIIVERSNPETVLSKISVNNVRGSQAMGYDFDAGSRLQESYAKAGKMFAKYLKKKVPVK